MLPLLRQKMQMTQPRSHRERMYTSAQLSRRLFCCMLNGMGGYFARLRNTLAKFAHIMTPGNLTPASIRAQPRSIARPGLALRACQRSMHFAGALARQATTIAKALPRGLEAKAAQTRPPRAALRAAPKHRAEAARRRTRACATTSCKISCLRRVTCRRYVPPRALARQMLGSALRNDAFTASTAGARALRARAQLTVAPLAPKALLIFCVTFFAGGRACGRSALLRLAAAHACRPAAI